MYYSLYLCVILALALVLIKILRGRLSISARAITLAFAWMCAFQILIVFHATSGLAHMGAVALAISILAGAIGAAALLVRKIRNRGAIILLAGGALFFSVICVFGILISVYRLPVEATFSVLVVLLLSALLTAAGLLGAVQLRSAERPAITLFWAGLMAGGLVLFQRAAVMEMNDLKPASGAVWAMAVLCGLSLAPSQRVMSRRSTRKEDTSRFESDAPILFLDKDDKITGWSSAAEAQIRDLSTAKRAAFADAFPVCEGAGWREAGAVIVSYIDHGGVRRYARRADIETAGSRICLLMDAGLLIETQRKSAISAARARLTVSVSTSFYVETDDDGRVLDLSPGALALIGKSREESLGDYLWDAARDPNSHYWRGALASAQDGSDAFVAVIGDREIEVKAAKLNAADTALIIWTGQDVTKIMKERRAFESARSQLDKTILARTDALETARRTADEANIAKSRFLANMSHELRTPLNAIIGYTDLMIGDMREDGLSNSQYCEDLDRVTYNAKHLLALINDILDLAKVEAGKLDVAISEVRLGDLIDELASVAAPLMAKNDNKFVINAASADIFVAIDKMKVTQCLLNLLSNAAKFTDAGKITLGVDIREREGAHRLVFEVADTGRGMSEEDCAAVFEEFAQADDADTPEMRGTGLGLPIVKRFAEAMGGGVTASSVKDEGSIFVLTIELANAPLENVQVAS